MNLILCGLPACGKSTIGSLLAYELKYSFIDTDRMIEKAYLSKTNKNYLCREICKHEGEPYFRDLEKQQIASLKDTTHSVIALGGGSLKDLKQIELVKSIGHLVYLKIDKEIIWERIIQEKDLPAYLDQDNPKFDFYSIAQKRMDLFENIADTIVDINHLSPQTILHTILNNRSLVYG